MSQSNRAMSNVAAVPNRMIASRAVWASILVLFAVSLQVLTTVEIGGNELRFGTSDLLLPVLLALVALKWLGEGGGMPEWRIRYIWGWIGLLTLWMGFALVQGRLQMGEWSTWALLNKGAGWLVLVAYLLLGGWMAALLDGRLRLLFVRALTLFAWLACAYSLVLYSLYLNRRALGIDILYPRPMGFFDNPNAFGIFIATVVVLHLVYSSRKPLFTTRMDSFGLALTLSTILLTASRSSWLGIALALPALLWMKQIPWTLLAKGVVVGLLLTTATVYGPPVAKIAVLSIEQAVEQAYAEYKGAEYKGAEYKGAKETRILGKLRTPRAIYFTRKRFDIDVGLKERTASVYEAFDMWRESPITGKGLGSYRHRIANRDRIAGTIHNSGLWLLAETGLVGALLFSAFFFLVLRSLYRAGQAPGSDPLIPGVFAVLLVLAGASIGTEVLYQRYLWFLTGLALAVPRPEKSAPCSA